MKIPYSWFKLLLTFIFCSGELQITAQTIFINGIVHGLAISSKNKVVIQNAKVDFTDSCTGKIYTGYTGAEGKFSIEVPANCPGFKYEISKLHNCDYEYTTLKGNYHIKTKNDSLDLILVAVDFIELPVFPFFRFQDNSFLFYYATNSAGEIDSTKMCDLTDLKNCGDSSGLYYFSEIVNCEQNAVFTIKCYYSKKEKNDQMAKQRAEYVIDYLVSKGVSRDRFIVEAAPFPAGHALNSYGEQRPDQSTLGFRISGYK